MQDIHILHEPFDPAVLGSALHADRLQTGAVVTFTGYVRDFNQRQTIQQLYLEHFPGMTEKSLAGIATQACQRWPLQHVHISHRVGHLAPGEPIVFVGTASAHREAAFSACAFIMDYLKTRAPFWKKEQTASGSHWVEGRLSDQQAAARWQTGAQP